MPERRGPALQTMSLEGFEHADKALDFATVRNYRAPAGFELHSLHWHRKTERLLLGFRRGRSHKVAIFSARSDQLQEYDCRALYDFPITQLRWERSGKRMRFRSNLDNKSHKVRVQWVSKRLAWTRPEPAPAPTSHGFQDFGCKLAVLDRLLLSGRYLDGLLRRKAAAPVPEPGQPIPAVLHFCCQLPLSADDLASVETLCFDGSNEIYQHIVPDWDGEDERFEVQSLEDLARLPALKRVSIVSLVADGNLSALLQVRSLEECTICPELADQEPHVLDQLAARGVTVR